MTALLSAPTDLDAAESDQHRPRALDNLTLSRKEGWRRFVDIPARTQPEILTRRKIANLGDDAIRVYNRQRREWHANLGPIKTPQLAAMHEDLWDIVDSNAQDGDKAKGAVAIDAFPGLGKTTSVLSFARKYHQREIDELGPLTDSGNERWPVCRVGLTGNTGMKEFNRAMLEFFAHPGSTRGTAADYSRRALDCVLSCQTRMLIVDDLHFLQWRNTNGIAISNHFKYIANEFPVTLIFIGVGLKERGLFSEGKDYQNAILAQTGRRTTRLGLEPFTVNDEQDREQWWQLLMAIEQRLVLADKYPGMLADELCDYLYARSTGHMGSLMTLINRGCQRAVRTGAEKLTADLLDQVKNDAASEKARRELELAIQSGNLKVRG
ncbi:ATP binding protein with TniB domain [Mycobacteroides abscessus subsp. massiliense]|nr:ATP binding protein with TniB domain [Mycobacteroides abscessus subsp. massiliense]